MKKLVMMMFGAPGSGKGTQANLLASIKGFYHFDSGKYLRSVLYDPANQGNKTIIKERTINEAGRLNTPKWVLGIFKKEARKIAKAGMSLVFSGSPRTMFEAFGNEKTVGLVKFLEGLYGKENMIGFSLRISPEAGAKRNSVRRTCAVCGTGVLADSKDITCPICQGELKTRLDDKPEIAKTRIAEYETRTMPILAELKNQGVPVIEINAELPPYQVFEEVTKNLPK